MRERERAGKLSRVNARKLIENRKEENKHKFSRKYS